MNLLILVLLQQLDEFNKSPKNPLMVYHRQRERVNNCWGLYCIKNNPSFMLSKRLISFLRTLDQPLGISIDDNHIKVVNKIDRLNLNMYFFYY